MAASAPSPRPRLQQRDEGQEELPVQPVLVQIVGRPVRGGDHHHAGGEQRLEQPPDDHRVGDVGDLHLVEGTAAAPLRDTGIGDRRDRIVHPGPRASSHPACTSCMKAWKCTRRSPRRLRLEEQVHQHRLAAPDARPR
jgi:hypothetical protein